MWTRILRWIGGGTAPSWSSVGRNDPCPCGSGKKFKRCCIDRDVASRNDARISSLVRPNVDDPNYSTARSYPFSQVNKKYPKAP